jgi:hypothetical protein
MLTVLPLDGCVVKEEYSIIFGDKLNDSPVSPTSERVQALQPPSVRGVVLHPSKQVSLRETKKPGLREIGGVDIWICQVSPYNGGLGGDPSYKLIMRGRSALEPFFKLAYIWAR